MLTNHYILKEIPEYRSKIHLEDFSTTFAHELLHTFGLPDDYTDEEHECDDWYSFHGRNGQSYEYRVWVPGVFTHDDQTPLSYNIMNPYGNGTWVLNRHAISSEYLFNIIKPLCQNLPSSFKSEF